MALLFVSSNCQPLSQGKLLENTCSSPGTNSVWRLGLVVLVVSGLVGVGGVVTVGLLRGGSTGGCLVLGSQSPSFLNSPIFR